MKSVTRRPAFFEQSLGEFVADSLRWLAFARDQYTNDPAALPDRLDNPKIVCLKTMDEMLDNGRLKFLYCRAVWATNTVQG